MNVRIPIRFQKVALAAVCAAAPLYALTALGQNRPSAPPPQQRMGAQAPRPAGPAQMGPRPGAFQGSRQGPAMNNATNSLRGAHLGEWMQQHNNLTPQQQQRALQNEPGFNQLPPQMQQRMTERLSRLNSMPEPQRQRLIQGGEALERLTPDQRGNVRSAMGQLGSLPVDRRQAVARAFRELRNLPPEQRNQILNSPQYRQQFNDEERGTLGNLFAVSPLLPPNR